MLVGCLAQLTASAFNRLGQYASSSGPKFTDDLKTILRQFSDL